MTPEDKAAQAASLHATSQRAFEARQVLDNPAFRYAMDGLKAEIVSNWRQAPIRDAEGQRLLLQMAKVCDLFEGMLVGMLESGKLAQAKIDIDDMRSDSTTRRLLRKVL